MKLMEEVYSGYIIASAGFDSSKAALEEISNKHLGYECVLYFSAEEHQWYILHRIHSTK